MAEDMKPPPESDERRKHRRYPHETALWIEIGEMEPLQRVLTVDVSASGVLIDIDQPLPVGGTFKIHFELPEFLDLISAKCHVRHCTHLDGSYRIGIEFDEVYGLTTKQLIKFLKAYFDD